MISITKNNSLILISFKADLINSSSQRFDLTALKKAIHFQIQKVYHNSVGKYSLDIHIEFNILNSVHQCSPKRILFQIVDSIPGNNPAQADFKGLRIALNKAALNDIISNRNTRTIPHEFGHLLGWDHPHANALHESVNKNAHLLEQQLTEPERKCNLMSQSWYAQRSNIPLEQAMQLTEKQIELLLLNYNSHQLNKNKHLNYFLFWKKII